MWRNFVVFTGVCFIKILYSNGHCVDIHSQIVSQGLHYVPGPNSCTLCICDKGGPKWCKSVLCSQPQNCKSFQRGNSCCEFKCLDDILTASDTYKDTYDLALRLIASAVFVILTLSLLFFVIHRFRKHKVQVRQNRQLSEDQRSLNSIGYITGSLGYLPGTIGYLGSGSHDMEFHYEETNAHFSLWKPPGNYFPRGEAPPPYEEAVRSAQIEANIIGANRSATNDAPNNLQHTRPTQVLSTNTLQCRHQQLTNSCNIINNNNNNQDYANIAVETITSQRVDPLVKTEHSLAVVHSKFRSNNTVSTHDTESCASAKKSKSYENIVNRPNNTNSKLENKNLKHKSQIIDCERSSLDKNKFKFHKYENVVLRNSKPKDQYVRKLENNASGLGESCYENINRNYENVRHQTKSLPAEYQNKTHSSHTRENKTIDKIYVFAECTNAKKRDETCLSLDSSDNLKKFQEYKNLPSHRTLPKNLKELIVSVSSNSEYIPKDVYKYESNKFQHRTLPKVTNHDPAVLSVNLIKSQINLAENCIKEPSTSKGVSLEPTFSSHLFDTQKEDKFEMKDEQPFSLISYQSLSTQEEDDYRSECENCKSSEMLSVEDEEGDAFNETMTLQRRPETSEEVPYYRTSLTLPTQIKKPRTITPNLSRNGWFTAMQETSSSEESD